MTQEKKEKYLDTLKTVSSQEGLSVDVMDAITLLVDGIASEPDDDAILKELSDTKARLESEITAKDNILAAYRRRWDESMVGTRVNGEYVDKTVTEVSNYTYEKLLGME